MACEAPGSAPPAAAPPRARLSVSKDTLSAPGMLFRNPVRVTGEPGPASLRAEAFGSMAGAYSYSYTQEEDTGMWAGGTTAGGVVLLPPESDMYEVGYDFAVPGRVYSSCYFVAGPGVRFAAGNPYPNNGSVASGYSWGATASELVFNTHGTTGGVGSNAVKFTSTQNIAFRSNTNYWGTFDHAITADRTWTFPDESGTVALTSALFTGGPFTAGSVIFSAGTLVLAEDNANLFWDDTNNFLGIGTASPAYRLHVVGGTLPTTSNAGALVVTGTAPSSGGTTYGLLMTLTSAGSHLSSGQYAVGGTLGTGYTGSDPTGCFRAINSMAASTGFNFGYYATVTSGTSTGRFYGVLAFARTTNASGKQVGGYFGIGAESIVDTRAALVCANTNQTDPIFLAYDGTTIVVTIADGGALQLGTASATTGLFELYHASSANKTAFQAGNATAAVTYTLPTAAPGVSGYALTSTTAGVMSWTSVGTVFGSGTATRVAYWSAADTLSSSADLYWDNSNVRLGIGTATPGASLSILSAATATIGVRTTAASDSSAITMDNDTSQNKITVYSYGSALGSTFLGVSRNNTVALRAEGTSLTAMLIGTFTADPVVIGTNDTERMRILSTGEFGIGTATPTFKLDVADTALASVRITSSSTISAGMEWNATGTGGRRYAWLSTANAADPGGGTFSIYDFTGSAYRLVVNSSGNVGIGTTGPDAKLDVLSTTTQLMLTHTDGTVNCSFAVSSSGVLTVNPSGTIILFDTVNEFRLNSATGVPQINLQNNGTSELRLETSSSVVFITNLTNNDMVFRTNSVERFRLKASEVVVNDTQADVDFRVESDTNANLLVCDAGASCVGVGTATFGATAANVLALTNSVTEPTTSVDLVHLYAFDRAAGAATLAIYQEDAPAANVLVASTHTVNFRVNGTLYKFLVSNV